MTDVTIRKASAERVLFVLFLALAIAAFAWTFTFPPPTMRGYPGPALFPRLILIALALFCISGLKRNLRIARAIGRGVPAPQGFDAEIKLRLGGVIATVVALGLFTAVLEFVGMEPALFCYLGIVLYLRTRRPLLSIICAFVGTVVAYFVFVLALEVHLPLMFLPRYPSWW